MTNVVTYGQIRHFRHRVFEHTHRWVKRFVAKSCFNAIKIFRNKNWLAAPLNR